MAWPKSVRFHEILLAHFCKQIIFRMKYSGSGHHGTRRGHTYAHNVDFRRHEVGSLVLCGPGRLLFRSSQHKHVAFVVDTETLQEIGTVSVPVELDSPLNVFVGSAPHLLCVRMRRIQANHVQLSSPSEASESKEAASTPSSATASSEPQDAVGDEVYEAVKIHIDWSTPSGDASSCLGQIRVQTATRLQGWAKIDVDRHHQPCSSCHRVGQCFLSQT
jgi:hypothetical protein